MHEILHESMFQIDIARRDKSGVLTRLVYCPDMEIKTLG